MQVWGSPWSWVLCSVCYCQLGAGIQVDLTFFNLVSEMHQGVYCELYSVLTLPCVEIEYISTLLLHYVLSFVYKDLSYE